MTDLGDIGGGPSAWWRCDNTGSVHTSLGHVTQIDDVAGVNNWHLTQTTHS